MLCEYLLVIIAGIILCLAYTVIYMHELY